MRISQALIVLFVAAITGCTSPKQPSAATDANWSLRLVQIERQWSDGQWYPMDALSLNKQFRSQGETVGNPNYGIKFEPLYTGDKVTLLRYFQATCKGAIVADVMLDQQNVMQSWQEQFDCGGHKWRARLVAVPDAKYPPTAQPGELLPTQQPQS